MSERDCLIIELYRRKRAAVDALHELSRELETLFRGREDGEYDGHEIAITGEHGRFFLYGSDARALREAVRPVVEACRAIQSGTYTCRRATGEGTSDAPMEETTQVVLSRKKPLPDERERDGEALVKAAAAGKLDEVKRLLAAGVSPDYVARRGKRTALHAAAEKGKLPVVEALLAAGASVDVRDEDDLTPLGHAVAGRRKSAAKALLAAGANINGIEGSGGLESTPLLMAVGEGDEEMFDLLVSQGADINACALPPDSELIDWYPLSFALHTEQDHLARRLLDLGADCTRSDLALGVALRRRLLPMAEELVRRGSPVNPPAGQNEGSLVESCCHLGRVEEARWLITKGARVDIPGRSGTYAIHRAAAGGYRDLLDELLARGADPLARDKQGKDAFAHLGAGVFQKMSTDAVYRSMKSTPPDWAPDHVGCVRSLWRHLLGADSEAWAGRAASLFRALLDDDEPAFSAALVNGTAQTAPLASGWTALHLAAALGRANDCERLVAHGAEVDAADGAGFTPFWWALALGHDAAAQTLQRLGARADLGDNVLKRSPADLLAIRASA